MYWNVYLYIVQTFWKLFVLGNCIYDMNFHWNWKDARDAVHSYLNEKQTLGKTPGNTTWTDSMSIIEALSKWHIYLRSIISYIRSKPITYSPLLNWKHQMILKPEYYEQYLLNIQATISLSQRCHSWDVLWWN